MSYPESEHSEATVSEAQDIGLWSSSIAVLGEPSASRRAASAAAHAQSDMRQLKEHDDFA